MKNCLLILFVLPLLISCKKEEKICGIAYDELQSHLFVGTMYACNGDSTNAENFNAHASAVSVQDNKLVMEISTNDGNFNNTLAYNLECQVAEGDIPIVYIKDESGNEQGQYNQDPDRVSFAFGYGSCLDNTWFEGVAN